MRSKKSKPSSQLKSSSFTVYHRIREIIEKARGNIARVVNFEMVQAYWYIGLEEQNGKSRAEYGEAVLSKLAEKLTQNFGKGFEASNLWNMRKFYQTFPILDTLRRELSWTHYLVF